MITDIFKHLKVPKINLDIAGLWHGPGKWLWIPGIFVNQENGNRALVSV